MDILREETSFIWVSTRWPRPPLAHSRGKATGTILRPTQNLPIPNLSLLSGRHASIESLIEARLKTSLLLRDLLVPLDLNLIISLWVSQLRDPYLSSHDLS